MTKIIAITGGKGGTGKSTVATALSYEISKNNSVLLVDADVDCPNDHLLLNIERKEKKKIYQRIPKINQEKCTQCNKCASVCKPKALIALKKRPPMLIQEQCNGCGACQIICSENAIEWNKKEIGKLYTGATGKINLLSGELNSNQPVSEFIVNHLNLEIEKEINNYDYIIIDTSAGTHCPVIASFKLAEEIIAVTEPTPLGSHDLEIILKILKKINKPSKIIINKSDIGETKNLKNISKKYNSKIILKIPFSKEIVNFYSNSNPIKIKNISEVLKQ